MKRPIFDGRELVSQSAWCYYPSGWGKVWGNPGYDLRRDFLRRVYSGERGQSIVEWTEGTIIIAREEIQELISKTINPKDKATFVRSRYV